MFILVPGLTSKGRDKTHSKKVRLVDLPISPFPSTKMTHEPISCIDPIPSPSCPFVLSFQHLLRDS